MKVWSLGASDFQDINRARDATSGRVERSV